MNRRVPRPALPPVRPSVRPIGVIRTAAALALAVSVLGFGCTASESQRPMSALEYTEKAKGDFDKAMRAFEDKNWELCEELFNDIRRTYSYSRYARLSELRLADANYEQDKIAEAIAGYKSFIHDYPNDPEVPYARFQVAKGEYDSVSVSFFLPPLEERDLAAVSDALVTIRGFLSDYPDSEHSEQLRYMLEVVLGLLARHDLYVARYYLEKDHFAAAAARVDRAVAAFPRSGMEPEALLLLAEIRLKQKKPDEARALLQRLLKMHPESPFSIAAKNYLAWMGTEEAVGVLRQGQTKAPAPAKPPAPVAPN